jgi:hypothetical protein
MTFATPLNLPIPCMARIRKYLAVKHPAGLVIAPKNDPLLFYAWSMIQTEKVKMRSYGRTPKPLTDTVYMTIIQAHHTRSRTLLNDAEIRMFNKTVDLYLFQEFFQKAQKAKAAGIGFEESLFRFAEFYDFSADDLQLDTLKKSFIRHRQTGELGFTDSNFTDHSLAFTTYF